MSATLPPRLNLVADIGGTNTRVALAEGSQVRTETLRKYKNASHDGIESVLTAYCAEMGRPALAGACAAAAGPVREGRAQLTNLDWVIDCDRLAAATAAPHTALLNDLQAQGHALGALPEAALKPLFTEPPRVGETQLVVGLGTGVNAAPVYGTGAARLVAPSECGHITLPLHNAEDLALAAFLAEDSAQAHGFAGVEDALSGRGIVQLDAFLAARRGAPGEGRSSSAIIAALAAGEARAQETLALYAQLLGRFLGDLALIHLPFGGLYLIGGMARALGPYLAGAGLKAAFTDKGRFGPFLEQFPLFWVDDDFAALTGCAAYLTTRAA